MFMFLDAYTQIVSHFVVVFFQLLNLSWLAYNFPASPFPFLRKSTIVVLVSPLCVLKVVQIVSIIS